MLRLVDPASAIDCEFTLALNNRTGKYFFCRDMIDASRDLIRTCYYWRIGLDKLPSKFISRVLGRVALVEINSRARWPVANTLLRPVLHRRPMVFTDPRECVLYAVKPYDVVLCHDMGPLTHPEFYHEGVKDVYALAFARIADAKPLMLFVSEATRRDFVDRYGTDFPVLDIVHIPVRQGMGSGDEEVLDGVPEKFFLTVGSLGARKNQARSIAAFDASGLAREGYGYVVCGGPEPGVEEVLRHANRTAGVIVPGYVNDRQLRWLYRNARGFVLPSLLEGFGMPAAEAISHGQIPLLSAGGALEEVAGDGALFVDPRDVGAIAAAMERLGNMTAEERESRLVRLRLNIRRFSFEAALSAWRSALGLAIQRWLVEASPPGKARRLESSPGERVTPGTCNKSEFDHQGKR